MTRRPRLASPLRGRVKVLAYDLRAAVAFHTLYAMVTDFEILTTGESPGGAGKPYICAEADAECPCSGTVYFGRRFHSDGRLMTFEGMRAFEVAAIPVDGTIPCTPEALGVPDPAPGRTKHCYCAPTLALAPCADEFDVCSCDGTVVFGRRLRNRVEEHVSGAGEVTTLAEKLR